MPTQRRITSAVFVLTLAVFSCIGGCSEQAAPVAAQEGVELTPEQAFAANLKKAEARDAEAQQLTGSSYLYGIGVAKDVAKATVWLGKSASQG